MYRLFLCWCAFWGIMGGIARADFTPCQDFISKFTQLTSPYQTSFVRSLLISKRIFSSDDILDLTSTTKVDGTLRCRGNHLVRLELRIYLPADPEHMHYFEQMQRAALISALNWDLVRTNRAVRTLSSEAKEYLRASVERGDIYLAGKTEYHEEGGDLGMIWTPADRTFILSGED